MKHTGLNYTMLSAVNSSVLLYRHFLWLILRCHWCNLYNTAFIGGMINEWWTGKDFEGRGHRLIKILSWPLPRGAEKGQTKPVRIAKDLAIIWTSHLPNKSQQHFCHTNPFVFTIFLSSQLAPAVLTCLDKVHISEYLWLQTLNFYQAQ
jgi:hypothetical protein